MAFNGLEAVAVAKRKARNMQNPVALENIEEMRRQQGIEDIELRHKIRGLARGHFVRLTFLTGHGEPRAETLLVRITSIRGCTFRGKLASKPSSASAGLVIGTTVVFTTDHIHSLWKGELTHKD